LYRYISFTLPGAVFSVRVQVPETSSAAPNVNTNGEART
jgi:hypothetical protein